MLSDIPTNAGNAGRFRQLSCHGQASRNQVQKAVRPVGQYKGDGRRPGLGGRQGRADAGIYRPLLAKLWDHPPTSDDWVHEIKYDGYRLQLHKNEINVSCYTRRGYDWRERFPDIAKAAWHLNAHAAILDGEAVVVTEKGDTDFSALEFYVSSKQADRDQHHVVFYAFDLLYLDGFDLRDTPLIGRKEALKALLADLEKGSPIQYSEHLEASGPSVLKQACDMELEGVVSKRKSAKYDSGRNELGSRSPAATARHLSLRGWRSRAANSTACI